MRCLCGTPYHEATGHRFTETAKLCGPCARGFKEFVKFQMGRKTGRPKIFTNGKRVVLSLAEAAVTSIRA